MKLQTIPVTAECQFLIRSADCIIFDFKETIDAKGSIFMGHSGEDPMLHCQFIVNHISINVFTEAYKKST